MCGAVTKTNYKKMSYLNKLYYTNFNGNKLHIYILFHSNMS